MSLAIWFRQLICIFCLFYISCCIDVTNQGGNSGPSYPSSNPDPQPQQEDWRNYARDFGILFAIIFGPFICCCICCCKRTGSENARKTPRPKICDSFLKTMTLFFAIPLLYAALRYKFVISRFERQGASGRNEGGVRCSVEHWNTPGITVRGEWTFLENDDSKCCHPSDLRLTIDDKLFDDTYYLKGEDWVGDCCPSDLQRYNELPITFDPDETTPAKFKATRFAMLSIDTFIDASNTWWECTQEGTKLFYKLNFYKNGKIQCSRTITKAGGGSKLYNETSQIIFIVMITILGLYKLWRVSVYIGSYAESQDEDEDERMKNEYNQSLVM